MRAIFSFVLLFFFLSGANAQGKANLVIFSEDGDPFFAIVNGIKQNSNPETNVKITDLNANSLSVKIIFVDAAIPPLSKNMYLEFGNEYTVKVKRDKKGEMVLRMFGQVPIEQSTSSAPAVVYHTTETPVTANTTVTGNNSGTATTIVERTETTTTTTTGGSTGTTVTTGTTGTGTGENVSLNMNVNGVGVNMNVNVDGTGMGTSTSVNGMDNTNTTINNGTTTTHVSTTTTTTTSTTGNVGLYENTTTGTNVNTGTVTSHTGCATPVSDSQFSEFKSSISSKTFSESKMQIAQQITKNNCLNSAQIRDITKLFDFETDRLTYAKYAYQYSCDKNNYYKVNDAFDFESSIDELNEFINK